MCIARKKNAERLSCGGPVMGATMCIALTSRPTDPDPISHLEAVFSPLLSFRSPGKSST